MAPPTTDKVVVSLCKLDDELTSLDLEYSLRQQYAFTVDKFLNETEEGQHLQRLINTINNTDDSLSNQSKHMLNDIIDHMPPISGNDHHHHHEHEVNTLPSASNDTTNENDGHDDDGSATTNSKTEVDQIETNAELRLLEHMTIEDKQLRPITIAICCSILFETWKKNKRTNHLKRSIPWVLHKCLYTFTRQDLSMYTTPDPDEYKKAADVEEKYEKEERLLRRSNQMIDYTTPQIGLKTEDDDKDLPTLNELLASIPYSTIVRKLEPEVEKLVKQRKLLEEAQMHAIARREARKRAILRTAAKWQQNSRHSYFIHWANIAALLKKQRQKLVSKFINMKAPTLKMIFDSWHVVAISERLKRCADERDEIKGKMNDLKEQLKEAIVTEKDLFLNLQEQIKRRENLTKKLNDTKEAIDAQRVPGTKEIMFETAKALINYGNTMLKDSNVFLKWAYKAPSVEKIARMYWVDREELRMKEREKEMQEQLDKIKEEHEIKEEKARIRQEKKRKSEEAKTEKRAKHAAEDAFQKAEEEFIAKFDQAKLDHDAIIRKMKKEAMDIGGEDAVNELNLPTFSPGDLGLTMDDRKRVSDKAASNASKAVYREERERLADLEKKKKVIEFENAKANDIAVAAKEKKFKEQQERRDNRISEEDIQEALIGMCTVPQDRLLLRWVKYHLRRSTRHGFPYRRKFMNFKNDIRDGVSYAVLLNKIAPETTIPYFSTSSNKMEKNLDGEIDPQLRIDTMLDQCARLDPPAVGFITRGHILGFEPFLNAAFVTRLFLTKHCLLMGKSHPAIQVAQEKYDSLNDRWSNVMETAKQLTNWDDWVKMRTKYNDGKLTQLLDEMYRWSNEMNAFVKSLLLLRERCNRGYQEWEPIYDYMNIFLYKMYSVKMNQEEEAPMGTEPRLDQGHCPFQLVDYRHEIKFLKYTSMMRDRIQEIIQMEATHHLRRLAIAERDSEIERGITDIPLTTDEINEIVAVEMNEKDVHQQIDEMEQILRDEYAELRLIFEFYAAGGEGGSAFDMSLAEFTRYSTDSKIVHKAKWVDKDDIKIIFDHAGGVEEVDETEGIGDEDISDEEAAAAETKAVAELEEEKEKEIEYDADGNPIEKEDPEDGEKKEGDDEEQEEDEYSWTLAEGEIEIVPKQWCETIIHFALRRYPNIQPLSKRVKKLIVEVIRPNACQANTETFRGELSMDEVQKIYKLYKPQLMTIFKYYAIEHPAKPGQPPMEPSMDGPIWLQMMKDSKLMTRKSDVPNDLPELSCREIFNNVQMEEEEDGGGDVGGGADEMIYMEYLEAWGAVACFKKVNPYVPLWKRMEETFVEKLFPAQKKYALAKKKKKINN